MGIIYYARNITQFWFMPTIVTRRLFKWLSKGYIVLLQATKAMKAGEVLRRWLSVMRSQPVNEFGNSLAKWAKDVHLATQ